MKGKAYKKSVDLFLRIIAGKRNIHSFKYFLEECLIENYEPILQHDIVQEQKIHKFTKKKLNQNLDSKMFNNIYD